MWDYVKNGGAHRHQMIRVCISALKQGAEVPQANGKASRAAENKAIEPEEPHHITICFLMRLVFHLVSPSFVTL